MRYADTSLIIALVTNEDRSGAALDWLVEQQAPLTTSEWTRTEVASALSIKQRRGQLTDIGRAAVERSLDRMMRNGLDVVPVLTGDFRRAAEYVRAAERNLRGADALHLAVAERLGATVHSLDAAQVAAARALGIDAVITVERE